MKILAFGHRQDVGKDTVCDMIIKQVHNINPRLKVLKAGFADKVKDIAYQLYSWAGLKPGDYYDTLDGRYYKNVKLPALGKSPREIYIGIGNGLRASVHKETWIDYLYKNHTICDVLLIKDLRFFNEIDATLAAKGFVFRIDNNRVEKVTDGADEPLEHCKEWTEIIGNHGLKEELNLKVTNIIGKYIL